MLLFKKNRLLLEDIQNYIDIVQEVMASFHEAMHHELDAGPDDQFETMAQRTHKHESNADDKRRDIEQKLFAESLMPEAREDLFLLIERVDRIPGKAESVLWQIHSQNMRLPKEYKEDFHELAEISVKTAEDVLKAMSALFGKRTSITEYARQIDNNESLGDGIERRMIHKIFRSGMDKFEMIILKELVIEMGHIIDRCQEACDSITMFKIKRHI